MYYKTIILCTFFMEVAMEASNPWILFQSLFDCTSSH